MDVASELELMAASSLSPSLLSLPVPSSAVADPLWHFLLTWRYSAAHTWSMDMSHTRISHKISRLRYLIAGLEFRWCCPRAFLSVSVAVVELSGFRFARNLHPITLCLRHLQSTAA